MATAVQVQVLSAIQDFSDEIDALDEQQLALVLRTISACEHFVRELLAEHVTATDTRVVVFVGANQVGKSTATLFLADAVSPLLLTPDRMLKLPDNHPDSPLIGTSFESLTVLPNVRDVEGMVFIDLPGVLDTRGVLPRLVNMVIAKQIFALPSVVLVHVIRYGLAFSHAVSRDLYASGQADNSLILLTQCQARDPTANRQFVTNGFDVSVMPYPSAPDNDTPYRELDGVLDWRAQLLQLLREKTPGLVSFAPREIHGERNLIAALQNTAIANANRLIQTILDTALPPAELTLEQATQVQQWLADVNMPTTFDAALALLEEVCFTQPGNEANARVVRDMRAIERLGGSVTATWFLPHSVVLHDAVQTTFNQIANQRIRAIVEPGEGLASITLEQATQLRQWLADANAPMTFGQALTLLEEIGFTQPGDEANARVLRAVQDLSFAWIQPHYASLHDAFPREAIEPSLVARDFEENVDVVCRRFLVLSEALAHLPGESSDLKTLVFIGFDSLHVDVGINQWVNVVLIGENVTVTSGVVFDLSANRTLRDIPQASEATDGVPGEPGQPGGSLLVRCSTLDGSIDFKSEGQKGGNGQRGGDGIDGATKWHTKDEIAEARKKLVEQSFSSEQQCWKCSDSCMPRALSDGFQSVPVWPADGALCTITKNDVFHKEAQRPGRGGRGGNGGLAGLFHTDVSGVVTLHGNVEGTGEQGGNGTAGAPSRDGLETRLTWKAKYERDAYIDGGAFDAEVDYCSHYVWKWKCESELQTEIKGKRKDALEGHAGEPAAAPPINAMTSSQSAAMCAHVIDRIETNRPLVRLTRQRAVFGVPGP